IGIRYEEIIDMINHDNDVVSRRAGAGLQSSSFNVVPAIERVLSELLGVSEESSSRLGTHGPPEASLLALLFRAIATMSTDTCSLSRSCGLSLQMSCSL